MASADPRQPAAARPYIPPIIHPQDLPPDYCSLLAIMFGISGVMLRNKLGSWLALICCVQSLVNMKNVENDLKQVIMAATLLALSFHGCICVFCGHCLVLVKPESKNSSEEVCICVCVLVVFVFSVVIASSWSNQNLRTLQRRFAVMGMVTNYLGPTPGSVKGAT